MPNRALVDDRMRELNGGRDGGRCCQLSWTSIRRLIKILLTKQEQILADLGERRKGNPTITRLGRGDVSFAFPCGVLGGLP